jgi:hypothetical protein
MTKNCLKNLMLQSFLKLLGFFTQFYKAANRWSYGVSQNPNICAEFILIYSGFSDLFWFFTYVFYVHYSM